MCAILPAQGEEIGILRLTLGDQLGQHQLGTVSAVSEGDLLNTLVLQVAQSTEGAGENGTVSLGGQSQNPVLDFRLVFQFTAVQMEHPVERLPFVGFFPGGSRVLRLGWLLRLGGSRRLRRAGDGVQSGSVAGFALYLTGGVQPGGVRFYLTAVNLANPVVRSTVSDGCAATVIAV